MPVSSYLILKDEIDEFKITKEMFPSDFMDFKDISWVAQVMPFIKEFSKPEDTVFEPFAGMGTTLIGAGVLERKSIGIELEKDRFINLQKRVNYYKDKYKYSPKLINGDSLKEEYPKDIDLVVTNFPYYNGTITNSEEENFYNIKEYERYLAFIENITKRCSKALKNDGYMVAFSENIRALNGNMIPQAYDICNILKKYLVLKEERIVIYEKNGNKEDDITITNRAHEYVYICKKKQKPQNYKVYDEVLKRIGEKNKYIVIGTYGLYKVCNAVLDNPPKDCDILVENNIEALNNIVTILKEQRFNVYSWQDIIDDNFDYNKLKGRYYIKAIKNINNEEYRFDITYECSYLNFIQSYNSRVVKNNINVANIKDITKLMRKRSNEKDKTLIYRISKLR